MKNILIVTLVMFGFGLFSCEDPIAVMDKQMMELHNEDMAQMMEMNKLIEQLESWQGELTADSTEAGMAQKENLTAALAGLNQANDDMRTWMKDVNGYKEKMAEMSKDDALSYLTEKFDAMKEVHEAMGSSMATAKEVLGSKGQ
ncbi:MAG: hypothetical protein AAFR61_26310 [Bacteroidota bacterium]